LAFPLQLWDTPWTLRPAIEAEVASQPAESRRFDELFVKPDIFGKYMGWLSLRVIVHVTKSVDNFGVISTFWPTT